MPDLKQTVQRAKERSKKFFAQYTVENLKQRGLVSAGLFLGITILFVWLCFGVYWGQEPETFDIQQVTAELLQNKKPVTGQVTAATLIHVIDVMLNKSGGYQSNDIMPPTAWMDNISNWEFGVLEQARDLVKAFRNDFSRAQSLSIEDKFLIVAQPQLNFTSDTWALPSTEGHYEDGNDALKEYFVNLGDHTDFDSQFYARADNLSVWLFSVEQKLGSLSQRLSASVGQTRVNTDLAGEKKAKQSTTARRNVVAKTRWLEVDDIFFQARGATWALIHFLQAIEIDFYSVLKNKNAIVSLRQIIRELQATQDAIWSPYIMNGRGFGVTANYSLVMASYISRANAQIIKLRELLKRG